VSLSATVLFGTGIDSLFVLGRGCPAAVLRLWLAPDTDMAPHELCGEKGNDAWQYLTLGNTARVSFTSADKTIGAQVSEPKPQIHIDRF
jgi:hypothetical protein